MSFMGMVQVCVCGCVCWGGGSACVCVQLSDGGFVDDYVVEWTVVNKTMFVYMGMVKARAERESVCVHVCVHACMCVCVCVCACACMYVCVCVGLCLQCRHVLRLCTCS